MLTNWTSFFGPQYEQLPSSTFRSSTQPLGAVTSVQTGGGGDPGAAVPIVQLVQWDMDLFTVSLPSLTSLVHMAAVFMVIDTLAASLSVVLPHAADHDTHQIDFTD